MRNCEKNPQVHEGSLLIELHVYRIAREWPTEVDCITSEQSIHQSYTASGRLSILKASQSSCGPAFSAQATITFAVEDGSKFENL